MLRAAGCAGLPSAARLPVIALCRTRQMSYFDEPSSYSTTIVHLSGGLIGVGGFVTVPLPVAMAHRFAGRRPVAGNARPTRRGAGDRRRGLFRRARRECPAVD